MDYGRFWDALDKHRPNYLDTFAADGTCPPPIWPEDGERLKAIKERLHQLDDTALFEHRYLMGDEAVKTWNAQGWHAICLGTTWKGYMGPRFLYAFEKALNSAPIGLFVAAAIEMDWCVAVATQNPEDIERFRHLERKAK